MKKMLLLSLFALCANAADYEVLDENIRNPKQTDLNGFKNTPMQPSPNEKWHVHDPDRTQPKVATPLYDGSSAPAPADAEILFDGSNLDNFKNKKWKLIDGAMQVTKRSGYQISKEKYGDIHLHVEWMVPQGMKGWHQQQGNSGVFLMGRYEVQVLNCWANRTYPDGMTGAIYAQQPPKFNVCRKPGEWNSYDIYFKAPVFEGKELKSPAYITVIFNGVKIHDNYEIKGTTNYRKIASYRAHGSKDHFKLQDHGNPNMFRNIWVAPLKMKLGK